MQISAFWHTFNQKINPCKSAKYHTFPVEAVLRASSTVKKDKGKGFPILDTERWARSWSRCTGSQPAGDRNSSTRRQAAITFRQACSYPAAEHHRPLAGTKLYCLVTEAQV